MTSGGVGISGMDWAAQVIGWLCRASRRMRPIFTVNRTHPPYFRGDGGSGQSVPNIPTPPDVIWTYRALSETRHGGIM